VGVLETGSGVATGTILLQGSLKGSSDRLEEVLDVTMTLTASGSLQSVNVTMREDTVARLKEARAS
jgi:hypothetical protein